MSIRYTFAVGTADDWATQNPVLAMGQPGYEYDTNVMRIGDGQTTFTSLPALTGLDLTSLINDAGTSGSKVWSSSKASSADNAILVAAQKYTDAALQGVSSPFGVVFQNSSGTWPNRPATQVVFAFAYPGLFTAPSWLVANVDTYFLRS